MTQGDDGKSRKEKHSAGCDAVPSGKGRRLQARPSGIHGTGVYAIRPIREGEKVIEYKGEIITWRIALARHPHDPLEPNHTFYFHLDDGHVIDAKYHGNMAKWINHSCSPNLEAFQSDKRVFLKALRDIDAGEELFYDYRLMIDGRKTERVRKEHACHCGSINCRGTMLDIKIRGERKNKG
ncbi:MAG TPA: SET domain-containing protein-lysine N-methyltransferase [Smithellaceae bacterium]|nr:SET domain-containing protein-lysine N-methyltransferase [Smithellaceae bacterium]